MGFRTSRLWFPAIPLSCHPNYRALTFTLAGLSPAEHTSLSWLQTAASTYIRSGQAPYQGPSCNSARAQGSKGGWDHSVSRRLSAILNTDHTSNLGIGIS